MHRVQENLAFVAGPKGARFLQESSHFIFLALLNPCVGYGSFSATFPMLFLEYVWLGLSHSSTENFISVFLHSELSDLSNSL